MKLEFSRQSFEKVHILNFMQIRPVRVELSHADGRTDRQTDTTKLIVSFRNFANAPKNPTWEGFGAVLCKRGYEDGRHVVLFQDGVHSRTSDLQLGWLLSIDSQFSSYSPQIESMKISPRLTLGLRSSRSQPREKQR